MPKYIPYPFFYDDVPVDISFVFEQEKPAGKHGFLTVQGRHFVFEDGTPVKFWGTNFNGAGCFPEKPYAEKLAKRLAKLGMNLVRFHQLDSEWHTPNMFAFTKGKRVTGAELDPESMDRLDYLIHCLKKEGIYCYMDMFTYRKFRSDEGVENAASLADAAKPYCCFSDKLIELQKDLCRRLWAHKNPYTGLAYCDDPVFVLAEIVNESDLFYEKHPMKVEPYCTEFRQKLTVWLEAKGIGRKAEDFDLADYKDETLIDFKMELQEQYYRTMMVCMRESGVKIPITGTNWSFFSPASQKTQLVTDFYDSHIYFYDWRWGEFEKRCKNEAITQRKDCYLQSFTYAAAADRPTYISEWDMPWPNEFRAESPIYSAAVGMLQDWSGFAIHTYSYSARLERMNMLGKEIASEKIGNTPYRQGIFSAWNDPAKFGLFYHSAILTRRGDVSPAKSFRSFNALSKTEFDSNLALSNTERTGIYSEYDFENPATPSPDTRGSDVLSDTGELYRNWEKNYGWVDTPRTKCSYGFLAKNGVQQLNGVSIDCKTDFAVVAMSSLTDDAITSSNNILLTAVGRARNTDSKFEGDLMLDIGKPPVEIEVIEADITIEIAVEGLKVWAISPEGYYIGTVPSTYADGKFSFRIGEVSQSMYYLIVKE